MATYSDLILKYRLFMMGYPFSHYKISPTPCAPLKRPLNEARVALITTAAVHTPEQPRFESTPMGDPSFREIPNSVDTESLVESHKSDAFDHSGVKADRN